MPQHFLLSAKARTLNLAKVMRLSDEEAETTFASIRWASTEGKPVCPHCGGLDIYTDRRKGGSLRFRCKHKECGGSFSLTSGTLFAFRQMSLRNYLAAIVIFCNEVKGKSRWRSRVTLASNTRRRSFSPISSAKPSRPK